MGSEADLSAFTRLANEGTANRASTATAQNVKLRVRRIGISGATYGEDEQVEGNIGVTRERGDERRWTVRIGLQASGVGGFEPTEMILDRVRYFSIS